jgi:hypothetical protein
MQQSQQQSPENLDAGFEAMTEQEMSDQINRLWWEKVMAHVPPLMNQKVEDAPPYW